MLFIRKWAHDRGGNVAIMFAFVLSLLALVAGLAIDYAVAIDRKKSMDAALDSAILAGVKAAADARQKGLPDWKATGERTMETMFAVNLPAGKNYEKLGFKGVVTSDGSKVSGTGSYAGHSFTTFMSMFGKDDVQFGSEASATVQMASYVDIHFLIDISASMGIGAELSDMQKMYAATGCEFACHQTPNWAYPTLNKHTPDKSTAAGATLRIDVIRNSITTLVNRIRTRVGTNSTVRVALHTFSLSPATPQALSSDLATVEKKAAALTMATGDDGPTFLSYALERLGTTLPLGGNGDSAASPLSYVILLTDGVEDSSYHELIHSGKYKGFYNPIWPSSPNWRATSPSQAPTKDGLMQAFSPKGCASIKQKKHRLLAVQIKYIIPPEGYKDTAYLKKKIDFVTKDLASPLVNTFSTCVSDPATDYVVASSSSQIGTMLNRILDDVVLPSVVALNR